MLGQGRVFPFIVQSRQIHSGDYLLPLAHLLTPDNGYYLAG
jgi:hypothetical protein